MEEFYHNKKLYVSSRVAQKKLGVSSVKINELCRTGMLDVENIGGVWYITENSIISYLNLSKNDLQKESSINESSSLKDRNKIGRAHV